MIQARVLHALAFPCESRHWFGHPYEDWEVPRPRLVVIEQHWTYNNDIVSHKYAREGYLLLHFFSKPKSGEYHGQDNSYDIVYHWLTFGSEVHTMPMAPTLETIPEEPEDIFWGPIGIQHLMIGQAWSSSELAGSPAVHLGKMHLHMTYSVSVGL